MTIMVDEKLALKIPIWKEKYKQVFKVIIGKNVYVYRVLLIKEVEKIMRFLRNSDQVKVEDEALKGVLWPENFISSDPPYEVSNKLVEYIMSATDIFNEDSAKKLINDAKAKAAELMREEIFQSKLTIMRILPSYKFSDFDNMTPTDFFILLSMAEEVFNLSNPNVKKPRRNMPIERNAKFASKQELELEAASQATELLNEHYRKYKK